MPDEADRQLFLRLLGEQSRTPVVPRTTAPPPVSPTLGRPPTSQQETTPQAQDEPPSWGQRVTDAYGRIMDPFNIQPNVTSLFRGLRTPQQALFFGPAIATARAREEGRLPTPAQLWRGGAEAVREDIGGREVVEEFGVTGGKAVAAGLALALVADPLWILPPAKLAKLSVKPALLKSAPAQRGLQAAARSRPGQLAQKYVVDPVGKRLVTDYGKPAKYVALAERRFREATLASERAIDIGKRIGALPTAEQRTITQYMEAGSTAKRAAILAKASKRGEDTSRLGALGEEAIKRDIAMGQQLMDTGLISPQTFERWKGRHIRREYLKYEDPAEFFAALAKADPKATARLLDEAAQKSNVFTGVGVKSARERPKVFSRRLTEKEFPEAARRAKGQIMEAAHPVAKGELLSGQAVALRRFLTDTTKKFGSVKQKQGFTQVPDTVAAGPAAGKWFPEAIASDLKRLREKPGAVMQKWQTAVGWWKYGKVVLSPGTHARNMMSNYMLASMAGLSPFRPQRYWQALRSIQTKDKHFQEAKKAGSFLLDTFVGTELPKVLSTAPDVKGVQKGIASALRKIGQKPSELYQFEEHLFKMAMYIDQRKAGVVPKAAAAAAEEALFNYRRVPEFIDTLRHTGAVPFVTFSYKAIPATARALWQRPATVNRIGNVFRTFEERTPEGHDSRQLLPEYMREGWMKLPWTDEKGRPQYFNMDYILPFGDIGELTSGSGYGGRGGPAAGLINSPLVNAAAALATGTDPFTNQQIDEQFGGVSGYIKRLILPSLMPGGYGWTDIAQAAKGIPANPFNIRAEPRTLQQALNANLLGIRVTPVDFPQQARYRLLDINREMRDVQSRLRDWHTAQRKGVDPQRVASEIEKLSERYAEIILKYAELRNRVVPSPEPPDVNETEESEAEPFQ